MHVAHRSGFGSKMGSLIAACVAAGLLAACNDEPTAPQFRGDVYAGIAGNTVIISNQTNADVFTFVISRKGEEAIRWYRCIDTSICEPPIKPGEVRRVELSDKQGTGRDTDILVHWWRAISDEQGKLVAESGRTWELPR